MKIFIDADGCNSKTRDIVLKFAQSNNYSTFIVADRDISKNIEHSENSVLNFVQVNSGCDATDLYILEHIKNKDLLITRDLHLAQKSLHKQAQVISDYGEKYELASIEARILRAKVQASLRQSNHGETKAKKNRDKQRSRAIAEFLQTWHHHNTKNT